MPSPRRHRPDLRALLRMRATRIALAGLVLIAATAAGSAALTLSYALSPSALAAMAGEGLSFRVEHVSLLLGPTPRVHVEGLEIDGLGSAEAADVDLRLRPLVHGEVRAHVVHLEDARIVLHRGPNGELLPVFGSGERGDLSALPAFEADGGEIRIVQGEKLNAVVRVASLSLGRFGHTGSAPLVLSGNVTGGDGRWHTHPISLRGTLVETREGLELRDGRARARFVGAKWFAGRDARARFALRDGRVEIESLDFRAYGGTWKLSGTAQLRRGARLDVAARADGVDLAALLSAGFGQPAKSDADLGLLRMRWDPLRVPWRGGPRFALGEGRGILMVSGGMLPGTSLLGALVGLEPKPTPIESFSAPVTLHDGRLHSEALHLVTGDYTLEARGSVGLDRSVALEGHLDLAGDLILPKGASVLPTMPVTLSGSLPRPHVDTHVSRGGIGAVAGAVERTGTSVVRTTWAVGEKVGGALGAVGRKVGSALAR